LIGGNNTLVMPMSTDQPSGATDGGDGVQAKSAHRLRYQELFEFAVDGRVVTDGQGVIVAANYAAATVLRCQKEFLIDKPLGLFMVQSHRRRFYESLARMHSGAESDEFEAQVGRGGEPRFVIVRAAAADRATDRGASFHWLFRDITERRQAEAARDELLRRRVADQEEERRRIARELHDSFGQLLSALLLGIRAVRDCGPLPAPALARLDEVQRLAAELGRSAHDLATGLRPAALDDIGLSATLQHYLEDWSARCGIDVQFQSVGLESGRFPQEVETTLYRIVQEALTNVLKHSKARSVSVVLERQDGHAIAVVEDNGVGFDAEAASASRLGLLGMRERLGLLDGHLVIESSPGVGTTVIALIPPPVIFRSSLSGAELPLSHEPRRAETPE
jgi:PAS domain S-box-containing protein